MAITSNNKIFIQEGESVIELTGTDKEAFIAQREADQAEQAILEAEYNAKKQARIDAITKLGEASGLTPAEIEAILNI
jgi:pyrroloquinoline quinone (PQQ) biosynthesis protein C